MDVCKVVWWPANDERLEPSKASFSMAAVLKLLERQLGLEELKRRLHDIGGRPGRSLEDNVNARAGESPGLLLHVSRRRREAWQSCWERARRPR